jgi:hypothetical protein
MWAETHQLGDVGEGAFAIEAAGLFRWRCIIGVLRGSRSDGICNGRLASSAGWCVATGLATRKAARKDANKRDGSHNYFRN